MAKIAWIEDDYDEIPSLVRLLELDGNKIPRYRTRSDVEKSIEEILSCDAVILDVILPPITEQDPYQGLSILKILREQYKYNKPIVICTVVRAPGVIAEARRLRVTNGNILYKPVRPSILAETVNNALRKE